MEHDIPVKESQIPGQQEDFFALSGYVQQVNTADSRGKHSSAVFVYILIWLGYFVILNPYTTNGAIPS